MSSSIAGNISVKAVGKNLSKKDIQQITKEGMKSLDNADYRNAILKKIDDSLSLKEVDKFIDGAEKLSQMRKVIENYGN